MNEVDYKLLWNKLNEPDAHELMSTDTDKKGRSVLIGRFPTHEGLSAIFINNHAKMETIHLKNEKILQKVIENHGGPEHFMFFKETCITELMEVPNE